MVILYHHHRLFSPLSRSCGRTFILPLQTTRFLASSLFSRSCLQSSLIVASQVFFGRPRGLLPSTSHPFQALLTQSDPSFLTTCPYHLSLFLLMQSVISSNLSFPSAHPWSAAHVSFFRKAFLAFCCLLFLFSFHNPLSLARSRYHITCSFAHRSGRPYLSSLKRVPLR